MSRFNSDTCLLKCQFAAFNLRKQEHQATSTMKQATFYSYGYFNPKYQGETLLFGYWERVKIENEGGKNTSFLSIN